ncbi:MAG: alcohol dehydrogenase catalytic domain-containing protein [Acidobacteriota bacterium]
MQQLQVLEAGRFAWVDAPAPRLSTDLSALVRPLAVARCDLDLHIATGASPMQGPFAFGHEMAGVVSDVGDGVHCVRPGDRVLVPFQISCGSCASCRRGRTNVCTAVPLCAAYGLGRFGGKDFGGGLSDSVLVPFADAMLLRVPDGLELAEAAGLADNVSDGYRTVEDPLRNEPGASVLIVGGLAQSVGLYAAMAALTLGSEKVVYTDWDPTRLRIAGSLGAETKRVDYRKTPRAEELFPITVDASATEDGLRFALSSTAPCGHCTGVSGARVQLELRPSYLRGVTYEVSRVQARATIPRVLEHVCCGRLNPSAVPSRLVPFSEAIDAMMSPEPKIVFVRDTR